MACYTRIESEAIMSYPFSKSSFLLLTLFKQANYEIYPVGGCVRNYLLKLPIQDVDCCSNATPMQMIALAKQHHLAYHCAGMKHGTISFIINQEIIEVTTYRKEKQYLDYRHPSEVSFTSSLQEDLKRRDFTINALCYDTKQIIDYQNGLQDLQNKVIRCIHNPMLRFQEDALRILRGLRLSMQLQFKICDTTYQAMQKQSNLLVHIANERKKQELDKMLMSQYAHPLQLLFEAHVLNYLFIHPIELATCKKVDQQLLSATTLVGKWAILMQPFHLQSRHLKQMKLAKHEIIDCLLLANVLQRSCYTLQDIRRILYDLQGRHDLCTQFIQLKQNYSITYKQYLHTLHAQCMQDCFSLKQLKINGDILLQLGYEGKQIGQVLKKILHYIVTHQESNNIHTLIKLSKEIQL